MKSLLDLTNTKMIHSLYHNLFLSFYNTQHNHIIILINSHLQDRQHWNHNGSSNYGNRAWHGSGCSGIRSWCRCRHRRQILSGGNGEEKCCNESNKEEGVDGECLKCHGCMKCREKENDERRVLEIVSFSFYFVMKVWREGDAIYIGMKWFLPVFTLLKKSKLLFSFFVFLDFFFR